QGVSTFDASWDHLGQRLATASAPADRSDAMPVSDEGRRQQMNTGIRVRRVYDDPSPEDGARVLVDRVWPRGLRKDAARLDEWAKDVAPSTELRTWYHHDPAKFG